MVGLRTPRLKRLAEIVSAQAMAQQDVGEDLEDGAEEGADEQTLIDDRQGLAISHTEHAAPVAVEST